MSKRNIKQPSTAEITWPYTPEPSPPLVAAHLPLAIDENYKMSSNFDIPRSKAITMPSRRDLLSPSGRPTLDEVLNNTAPSPFTLAAYTAFLSQQHCLETLEFTTEAKKYADKYDEAHSKSSTNEVTTETDEGYDLMLDWVRILDVYVKPGAPREINLPAEERDDLIEYPYDPVLPPPSALDPSVRRMYDLMSDSIFIPFCNSLKGAPYSHTYSPTSDIMGRSGAADSSRLIFSERRSFDKPRNSRRRTPPPTTVPMEARESNTSASRSARSATMNSALSRNSGTRLTTHTSASSAASDSAMSDSGGNKLSSDNARPSDSDVMTPPTTPPMSDISSQMLSQRPAMAAYSQKTQRSESGGWKKMGMKIFGPSSSRKSGTSETGTKSR